MTAERIPDEALYVLGWDLGGAHVKAVLLDASGVAVEAIQVACPLWQGLDRLRDAVDQIWDALPYSAAFHAVTMTGELADIFSSREEGVVALSTFMEERFGTESVCFYAGIHGFITAPQVRQHAADIASANWRASAAFLAGVCGDALLLDVGSTTSDLMLLYQGAVASPACGDAERMQRDELVYTGVVRTPLMAIASRVPFQGGWQGVAAEVFATAADVYRLTGDLEDVHDMAGTADGAGKTMEASARRLARMVGCDLDDAGLEDWIQLASTFKSRQLRTLQEAAERALSRGLLPKGAPLIGAGAGRFLVQALARQMDRPYQDAAQWVQAVPEAHGWAVVCLPAYAVARLSMEQAGLLV